MRIIGIDPGTNKMGYAIIDVVRTKATPLVMGYIDLTKLKDPYAKLAHIFERVTSLIEQYSPDEMALEAPFFGVNVQSMLKLGRAQGVAMAAALNHKIDVFEYAPRKVKIAITGTGTASKEQVAKMLQKTLALKEMPENLDASDSLAVAMCHFYRSTGKFIDVQTNSWSDYIEKNKDKITKLKK